MTCPHWQGKCRHIGEALPYTGTISPMHHHKTRQLGRQHASCHLQSFNDTFSIGRREEVLLDWNFVQSLQEYKIYKRLLLFDLAACTIWKEVDAVNRGCFAFRLLIILARKQLTAGFSLTMTKGLSGAVLLSIYAHTENRVTCDWFQWHFNVVFNAVDLNHNFAASLFFIFESFCLFALNKHVLFEVEVILQLINSLCLCSHLVIDFESHSILYLNLKKCMQIGNSSKCLRNY